MATASTIEQISNSSDRVWEALCVFEDTHDAATARAFLGDVSAADLALFEECLAEEIAKIPAPTKDAKPSTVAARNAAAAIRSGADFWEGKILDAADQIVGDYL